MPEDWNDSAISAALLDFQMPTHARVLDIGCGDGKRTNSYMKKARSVVGIDPNQELLVRHLERIPATMRSCFGFVKARAETLPFHNASFDLGLLSWSL